MLIEHAGRQPQIDSSAWIAPDATLCGDVHVGPGSRILYGARVIGEAGGMIQIGRECIVMENAVVRATDKHACTIGDYCLVGPNAHVVGATVDQEVFIATSAAVFHGARLGRGAEVRPHGTVHLRTAIAPGAVVPIGWVAVGDPAQILPPDQHEKIWTLQQPLNFPEWVYGLPRETAELMRRITGAVSARLKAHAHDRITPHGGA